MTRLRVVLDTQRDLQQKMVTEEEDEEEADKHLTTYTEMYRCASYVAETKTRYISTTHDPSHTKMTLTTQTRHDHTHSRS